MFSSGKIKYVINKSSEVYFIYYKVNIVKYNLHLNAFEITETENSGVINQIDLVDYKAYNSHCMSNMLFKYCNN